MQRKKWRDSKMRRWAWPYFKKKIIIIQRYIMSDRDDLILLALLRLLVEEDKPTEQIEDSKRSRIWSYQLSHIRIFYNHIEIDFFYSD